MESVTVYIGFTIIIIISQFLLFFYSYIFDSVLFKNACERERMHLTIIIIIITTIIIINYNIITFPFSLPTTTTNIVFTCLLSNTILLGSNTLGT